MMKAHMQDIRQNTKSIFLQAQSRRGFRHAALRDQYPNRTSF